jgi:hypothetical protein
MPFDGKEKVPFFVIAWYAGYIILYTCAMSTGELFTRSEYVTSNSSTMAGQHNFTGCMPYAMG